MIECSIMLPGMPHFVFSAYQPERRPVSAVVSGSHCLSRFTMEASLLASIKHAFWHDVWTNATHDDRDFLIARMLIWQQMWMEQNAEWPFVGVNLYALLAMGRLSLLLRSAPFSLHPQNEQSPDAMDTDEDEDLEESCRWLESYDPTRDLLGDDNAADRLLSKVRHEMVQVVGAIRRKLSPSEDAAYGAFLKEKRRIFMDEYERRCNYNRS